MTLAAKLLFKAVEGCLRLRSGLVRFLKGRRGLLVLEERTPLQQSADARALASLALLASMPSHDSFSAPCLAADSSAEVLVLVPFRDKWDLTQACVDSLLRQDLAGLQVTVALIDNGSETAETRAGLSDIAAPLARAGIALRILRLDIPFNFSIIVNTAVRALTQGSKRWLLLLNNDVVFRTPKDLFCLVATASHMPDLGAASPTLLYPDGRVQHVFLAPGVKGMGAHPLKGKFPHQCAEWFTQPRAVAAVSGAVMLMREEDFLAEGGFDEALGEGGQDLDFCLRLAEKGRVHWAISRVSLTHLETATRSRELRAVEYARFADVWRHRIASHPLYSSSLSRWCEQATLSAGLGGYPWHLVAKTPAPPKTVVSPVGKIWTGAEFSTLRRSIFGSRLPFNERLRALCQNEAGHRFLTHGSGQFIYVYLTAYVAALARAWTGKTAEGIRVLDWGTGKGHVSFLLKEHNLDVVSSDVERSACDSSFGAQPTPILKETGLRVVPLTHASKLPFADASFDVVVSFGVLEHVSHDFASLHEIHRILAPGGLLVCTHLPATFSWTQNLAHARGNFYHDRLYSETLARVLATGAGFHVMDLWHRQLLPKNSLPLPAHRFFEAIDLFFTEHTPLRHLATNIEFVAVKPRSSAGQTTEPKDNFTTR